MQFEFTTQTRYASECKHSHRLFPSPTSTHTTGSPNTRVNISPSKSTVTPLTRWTVEHHIPHLTVNNNTHTKILDITYIHALEQHVTNTKS
ncbi:hypothetical protein SK128_024887 [Halocaridina rubra]|uniref:Uncharacterized protein n=1 Tax=Halocaridina rubra TaxID=373956 RepID=A0AAN8X2S1_HALRR